MPEEREALQNVLVSGYHDAFRHLYPDVKQFTWWDYGGGAVWKNEGMRLDYILCNGPLLERLKSVEVDMWPRRKKTPTPSDHAPLIATFEF
jgi:exodeoxyribonuclease-3